MSENKSPITASHEVTVTINGKVFCLEEPSALDYNNYLIASEREDKKMLPFINNDFLIYIKSIDGIEFKKPLTQSEIIAGLMRVGGKKTMDKLKKELRASELIESEENSEVAKEELKK
jgi:hypothetical protein